MPPWSPGCGPSGPRARTSRWGTGSSGPWSAPGRTRGTTAAKGHSTAAASLEGVKGHRVNLLPAEKAQQTGTAGPCAAPSLSPEPCSWAWPERRAGPTRAPKTRDETCTRLRAKPPWTAQVLARKNRVSVRPPRAWHRRLSPRVRLVNPVSPSGGLAKKYVLFKRRNKNRIT